MEFAADGNGARFQGYNNGVWIDYGLPGSFAYNDWYELEIALDSANDKFNYLLDGMLLGSVGANGSVGLDNVILQGYNNYGDNIANNLNYAIQWRNLDADVGNNVPEPGSMALILAGLGGMLAVRRKTISKSLGMKT